MKNWCKILPFFFIQWWARRHAEILPYNEITVHQVFPDTVITVDPDGFAKASKRAKADNIRKIQQDIRRVNE